MISQMLLRSLLWWQGGVPKVRNSSHVSIYTGSMSHCARRVVNGGGDSWAQNAINCHLVSDKKLANPRPPALGAAPRSAAITNIKKHISLIHQAVDGRNAGSRRQISRVYDRYATPTRSHSVSFLTLTR
jgi:hypothetical protein